VTVPVFAVEVGDLFQVVWVAALSGIGIAVLFSLTLLGYARATEARRAGRTGSATLNAAFAAIAFAVFAVGVVLGVQIMLRK
jgi:hypothetical protein